MAKRAKPEEIIAKLREVEVRVSRGETTGQAVRAIGVTEQTYYRWRREYGGMGVDQAHRLKELEKENLRLRKAVSDATLSAARLALRTQKGIEDRTIRVTPRNLLVPPALETTAEKWLASIAPATAADVNPFSGSLSLVVEPRLSSATRWYVTADPGEIDGLEFAYLSGAEGPQVESRSGWDVDGVEIRVILDFGAGFIDWRGWYANEGV